MMLKFGHVKPRLTKTTTQTKGKQRPQRAGVVISGSRLRVSYTYYPSSRKKKTDLQPISNHDTNMQRIFARLHGLSSKYIAPGR